MSHGRLVVQDVGDEAKARALRGVLRRLSAEYLCEQFVDSCAADVYRQLSPLNVALCANHSWNAVEAEFGVTPTRGCLPRLVAAIMQAVKAPDLNKKSRAFVRSALESFLLRAVGDDPRLYFSGTADQIIENVQCRVFQSASAFFLGDLLYQVARAEEGALPEQVKDGLRTAVQAIADRVIEDFERRYAGKALGSVEQVSHRHLFDVIASQPDWFLGQLRQ